MPKVERAKASGAGRKRRASPRRTPVRTPPAGRMKLSHWLSARLRAARRRASYALRLAAMTGAVIAVGALAVMAALGRLGDVGAGLQDWYEARLGDAGYQAGWVDVSGASRVEAADIAALIGAQPGTGMIGIDPHAARAALEELSWVDSASVLRLWPDRIGVIITEREPFALWQHNQRHHVIDRSGVVIEAADPADFADLPIVIGDGAPGEAARLMALMALHPEIEARTTHRVRVGARRWSLRLESGGEVLLPEADPAGALAHLSMMHAERGVLDYDAQIIDLRVEGEMVLRPWPERTASGGRGA
ncbi:FtsQ-type POTRA domain-containing protein [Alkalicaulis satelles]|uniref:Cell division protein FtsQ n=1 Tax=Alkalicaulis satelles TaxID=2609175 RepID=A0A5M6ZKD2_9PROT|nr:cell division protein FtsQ/DivIB [Alkalicaulis satelles]KAA5805286.1 FtsQ-type POTRA domain-containing protein [Alkalicaulis satelles]